MTAGLIELQCQFWTGQYSEMNSCKESDVCLFYIQYTVVALRTVQ